MSSYLRGKRVRFTGSFKNLSGSLTDPSTVIFKYETPGGTQSTLTHGTDAAVVKSSAGVYYVDLDLDTAGRWAYRWEGSGALVAAEEGEFQVMPSRFDAGH